ncbi:hypothetical protein PRIPAC_75125 [Pristionchus pacificus]|uniref:Uncharacterized protein n=1 Tax=Pristionchus pacificus TaxID=54126 RepID=A0A2A6C692_PRIPA|nr:hypothetical protein PRIPAC_75125 [Pristionchus pacificus]|eukprot:PDM73541.1 hypothetical protein PRIPAC_40897 [Pristionchus pacificus]
MSATGDVGANLSTLPDIRYYIAGIDIVEEMNLISPVIKRRGTTIWLTGFSMPDDGSLSPDHASKNPIYERLVVCQNDTEGQATSVRGKGSEETAHAN